MFGDIANSAYYFAEEAHSGQTRKYIDTDYIVHPMKVAQLVGHYLLKDDCSSLLDVQTAYCAAILHDTIEDCDTTYDDVYDHFGYRIADTVMDVTNPSIEFPGLNRASRKKMDRDHLANSSYLGASIKLADIIDNCTDIVAYDPDFARVYLKEKKSALEVLRHGNKDLLNLAHQTVDLGLKMLEK